MLDQLIEFVSYDNTIGFPFYGEEFPDWFIKILIINTIALVITIIIAAYKSNKKKDLPKDK